MSAMMCGQVFHEYNDSMLLIEADQGRETAARDARMHEGCRFTRGPTVPSLLSGVCGAGAKHGLDGARDAVTLARKV